MSAWACTLEKLKKIYIFFVNAVYAYALFMLKPFLRTGLLELTPGAKGANGARGRGMRMRKLCDHFRILDPYPFPSCTSEVTASFMGPKCRRRTRCLPAIQVRPKLSFFIYIYFVLFFFLSFLFVFFFCTLCFNSRSLLSYLSALKKKF